MAQTLVHGSHVQSHSDIQEHNSGRYSKMQTSLPGDPGRLHFQQMVNPSLYSIHNPNPQPMVIGGSSLTQDHRARKGGNNTSRVQEGNNHQHINNPVLINGKHVRQISMHTGQPITNISVSHHDENVTHTSNFISQHSIGIPN
jgi:hypothetical protein